VIGLVPWLITGWRLPPGWPWPAVAIGVLMVCAGISGVVAAFVQFVVEGRGTPAPIDAPRELVVRGIYRHVRNPMYVGLWTVLLGEALVFRSIGVLIWALIFAVVAVTFVRLYEEPTLRRRFGAPYENYHRGVPRWRPRLRPWSP
jgi:protein-S-isoprenylcysteine O-methyltransferase Ste14